MIGKGELLITVLSSISQEEARSISENTTWGQRKRFADGKAFTAQSGAVTKFDEGLWGTLVDFMTVYSKDDISVTFKNGTEIHIG